MVTHIAKLVGNFEKNNALQSVCAEKTARLLSSVGAGGLKYDVQNHKLLPYLKLT